MDTPARRASFNWVGWLAGAACAAAATSLGTRLLSQRGYGGTALAASTAALFLLVLAYFLPGCTDLSARLAAWMEHRRARVLAVGLLLLPYLVYAVGTGAFSATSVAKLAGYLAIPLILLLWAERSGPPPRWQDALAVLALWLPRELGFLSDVWPWPDGLAAHTFNAIFSVVAAVVLFVIVRRLNGVGYRFTVRLLDLRLAGVTLLAFCCIAIPFGLWTGFLHVGPPAFDVARFLREFFGILVVVAIPEELLFRGLIQNLLQRVLPAGYALVVASLIFGASHLNNGPSPDWRYVLLATIAGLFYGYAYRRSGGLMAACLVHSAVDAIHRGFFK